MTIVFAASSGLPFFCDLIINQESETRPNRTDSEASWHCVKLNTMNGVKFEGRSTRFFFTVMNIRYYFSKSMGCFNENGMNTEGAKWEMVA